MAPISIGEPDESTFECPTCGRDDFSRQRDMRVHHTKAHGERLVDLATCENCGDHFEPHSDCENRYCSLDCAYEDRITQVEKTCERCGDEFTVTQSDSDQKYCSRECYARSLRTTNTIECEGCGAVVKRINSRGNSYCSNACFAETRCSRPRPDDLEMLAWLLYEYEENTLKETYKRINCIRNESVDRDEVSDILSDLGVLGKSPADRLRRRVENGHIDADLDGEAA